MRGHFNRFKVKPNQTVASGVADPHNNSIAQEIDFSRFTKSQISDFESHKVRQKNVSTPSNPTLSTSSTINTPSTTAPSSNVNNNHNSNSGHNNIPNTNNNNHPNNSSVASKPVNVGSNAPLEIIRKPEAATQFLSVASSATPTSPVVPLQTLLKSVSPKKQNSPNQTPIFVSPKKITLRSKMPGPSPSNFAHVNCSKTPQIILGDNVQSIQFAAQDHFSVLKNGFGLFTWKEEPLAALQKKSGISQNTSSASSPLVTTPSNARANAQGASTTVSALSSSSSQARRASKGSLSSFPQFSVLLGLEKEKDRPVSESPPKVQSTQPSPQEPLPSLETVSEPVPPPAALQPLQILVLGTSEGVLRIWKEGLTPEITLTDIGTITIVAVGNLYSPNYSTLVVVTAEGACFLFTPIFQSADSLKPKSIQTVLLNCCEILIEDILNEGKPQIILGTIDGQVGVYSLQENSLILKHHYMLENEVGYLSYSKCESTLCVGQAGDHFARIVKLQLVDEDSSNISGDSLIIESKIGPLRHFLTATFPEERVGATSMSPPPDSTGPLDQDQKREVLELTQEELLEDPAVLMGQEIFATCTLQGWIRLADTTSESIFEKQVDHELFKLMQFELRDTSCIVFCAWDGMTYFLNLQEMELTKFRFQEGVANVCCGDFNLGPTIGTVPCLIFATFNSELIIYYDFCLPIKNPSVRDIFEAQNLFEKYAVLSLAGQETPSQTIAPKDKPTNPIILSSHPKLLWKDDEISSLFYACVSDNLVNAKAYHESLLKKIKKNQRDLIPLEKKVQEERVETDKKTQHTELEKKPSKELEKRPSKENNERRLNNKESPEKRPSKDQIRDQNRDNNEKSDVSMIQHRAQFD